MVLQADLRFREKRRGPQKGRELRTFLYLILSFPLSHSSRINPPLPARSSFPNPPSLSQLNSWPKVSFFALSWASSFLLHPLSFSVGQMLYPLFLLPFASGRKRNLDFKWWHTEKEHCMESDSNGFLVGVIELDFAFSN